VEVTISSNIEPLLPSRASYARSLSCTGSKLHDFRSYLMWMCIDQSDIRHGMVSWSLFLLSIFVPIVSHSVLSYASHPSWLRCGGLSLSHLHFRFLLPLPLRLRSSLPLL
ncbi:hypothetical protein BHM03_00025915, partial [Ensete ventricosum]